MKLAGIAGKGSGRMGSMVFRQSGGEQVVAQYNPNVSNPNTKAQVKQRGRFKVMSQVAAAVASEIVIPKNGLQSPRNLFVKKNFDLSANAGNVALMDLPNLQFTAGSTSLPALTLTRADTVITATLASVPNVTRVIFFAYQINGAQELSFIGSEIATVGTAAPSVEFANIPATTSVVVYAYGMSDTTGAASAKYGNYNVRTATDVARLILSRSLAAGDYRMTATVGAMLYAGSSTSADARLVSLSANYVPEYEDEVTVDTIVAGGKNPIGAANDAYPKALVIQTQGFNPASVTDVTISIADGVTSSISDGMKVVGNSIICVPSDTVWLNHTLDAGKIVVTYNDGGTSRTLELAFVGH